MSNWVPRSPPIPVQRRYGRMQWFRHENGMVRDARWKLLATKIGCERVDVAAVVFDMLELANQASPRGSVEEFDAELTAVALDLPSDLIHKIYAGLVEIGCVEQGHWVEWYLIAREKEDPNATQRSRESRKRRKERKAAAALEKLAALRPQTDGRNGVATVAATPATPLHRHPQSPSREFAPTSSACNGVATVAATTRAEQNIQKLPSSEASLDHQPSRELNGDDWLFGQGRDGHGVQLVASCLAKDPHFAAMLLRNWLSNIQGDRGRLRSIIEGAAHLRGEQFQAIVHEAVWAAVKEDSEGPALPLGPVPVKNTA